MHDVNVLRLKAYAYILADGVVVRRLNEPLKALKIDDRVVMHTLKRDRGDGAAKVTVVRRHDVDVLRTDNDVHGFVFLKACVNALKASAEELHESVLKHHAVEDIAFADEIRNEGVFRLVVNILRRTDLLDAALVHDDDGVGHRKRLLLIVSYIYKSNAHRLLNTLELVLHILAETQIQSAQGFVEQQHLGAVHERTSNCDTLLLTAGELSHSAVFKTLEAHYLKHFGDTLVDLLLRHLCYAQTEGDVFVNVEMRKQSVLLKDRVDLSFVRRDIVYPDAVKHNVSGGRLDKAADYPERRCLAAAGRTEQRQKFLIIKIQVNIV